MDALLRQHHVPAPERAIQGCMAEIENAICDQFYPELCKQLDRHPGRKGRHQYLPRAYLFFDLPVFKYAKQSLRDVAINGGFHVNGVISISPQSRLKGLLSDHINQKHWLYARDQIKRIHVQPLTHDPHGVVDYSMKTLKRGRFDGQAVIILPKSSSEMSSNNARWDARTRAMKHIQSATNVSDQVAKQIVRATSSNSSKQ